MKSLTENGDNPYYVAVENEIAFYYLSRLVENSNHLWDINLINIEDY